MLSAPCRSIAVKIRTMRAVLSPNESRGTASTGPIAMTCWPYTLHSTPGSSVIGVPFGGIVPSEVAVLSGAELAPQTRGNPERDQDRGTGDDAQGAARPRHGLVAGAERSPDAQHHNPKREEPLRARLAEEREGIERVGERREQDVGDGTLEIGVAGRGAGDGVDERGKRMNGGDEQQEHQCDCDRVAAQQVHHEISRMSGSRKASGRGVLAR